MSGAKWRVADVTTPSAAQLCVLGRSKARPRSEQARNDADWWQTARELNRSQLLKQYGFTEQRLATLREAHKERRKGQRNASSDSE